MCILNANDRGGLPLLLLLLIMMMRWARNAWDTQSHIYMYTEDIERLSYYLHLIRIEEHSYCSIFFLSLFSINRTRMTNARTGPNTLPIPSYNAQERIACMLNERTTNEQKTKIFRFCVFYLSSCAHKLGYYSTFNTHNTL